jgi:hypothetical protein
MRIDTTPGGRIEALRSAQIAVACAYGLVLASMGFGAVYAWQVGYQHSLLMAILTVVMAIALEGIKPIAIHAAFAAFAQWSLIRGVCLLLLGAVAVAYSLVAEVSLVATSKGDIAAQRSDSAKKVRDAERDRNRIAKELEAIGIVRPASAIRGELNALLADKRLNDCEGWLASMKLRAVCIDRVAPLRVELGRAERREKL